MNRTSSAVSSSTGKPRQELADKPAARALAGHKAAEIASSVSSGPTSPCWSPLAESIMRFRVLDAGFTVSAKLTPAQKACRHHVLDKCAAGIDAGYA